MKPPLDSASLPGQHRILAAWDHAKASRTSANRSAQTLWQDAEWEQPVMDLDVETVVFTGWPEAHIRTPSKSGPSLRGERWGAKLYRSPVPGWSVRDLICLAHHRAGAEGTRYDRIRRCNTALLQLLAAPLEELEAEEALLSLDVL